MFAILSFLKSTTGLCECRCMQMISPAYCGKYSYFWFSVDPSENAETTDIWDTVHLIG